VFEIIELGGQQVLRLSVAAFAETDDIDFAFPT
jgi:hypothetical protein